MKRTLQLTAILTLCIGIPLSFAANKKDPGMESCVQKKIKERSIVLPGGHYSDPGGGKKKGATEECKYEKATQPKKFRKKYGKIEK